MLGLVSVLMKRTNQFDCLVYEMFFIQMLRPALNFQSDSTRAKHFNYLLLDFSLYVFIIPFTPANIYFLLICIYIYIIYNI